MKQERPVYYFDNNATTRVAPEVVEAMLPFLTEQWGNPSSAYGFGRRVAGQVEEARARVAKLIHADPREVVFTSGGTESINTALHSGLAARPEKRHVVTTAVEHSATLKYCEWLQKQGYEVTFLPVNGDGLVELEQLREAIRSDTALVSVIWANNETGVLQPLREMAALCRERGVPCHADAVQAPGKLQLDVEELGVDFLSFSGHKLYAPKGIGGLFVRQGTRFSPYVMGGGQERGRRGGTENVANIVGFGRAAELAVMNLAKEDQEVRALRDRLERGILKGIPGTARNGCAEPRLPNTTNVAFAGLEAESILMLLDQAGICASMGSACTTGSVEPSHVLTAMGRSPAEARGSIRFSLGVYNTGVEVDYVLERLGPIVERLRSLSPPE